ncbi:hypothetical protein ABG067_005817 [Albugo candida]
MSLAQEVEAFNSFDCDIKNGVLEKKEGCQSNIMVQSNGNLIAKVDNKRFRSNSHESDCVEKYQTNVHEDMNDCNVRHPPSPSIPSSPTIAESDACSSLDEVMLQLHQVIDNLALAYRKWREEGDLTQVEISKLLESSQIRRARLSKQLAGICDNIMEGLQQTDDE